MEYKVESSLWDFQAWSGGKDTLEVLKEKGDCDAVESALDEYFGCGANTPTETEINDILWFERDWIAEGLGYKNWDAYEEGWSESDLEDAENWWVDDAEPHVKEELSGTADEDEQDEWWEELDDAKKVEVYYAND